MRNAVFSSCNHQWQRWLLSGPPFSLCEAPARLSLFSQRVRVKLTTSTQGFMPQ